MTIQLAYNTGSPLANHEEVSHVRDMYEQTPAGTGSNSLHRLSGHSDTPLADTGAEMPQERPDERSGEKRWTSAACYTRTWSRKHEWRFKKLRVDINFRLVVKWGVSGRRDKEGIPKGRFIPLQLLKYWQEWRNRRRTTAARSHSGDSQLSMRLGFQVSSAGRQWIWCDATKDKVLMESVQGYIPQ